MEPGLEYSGDSMVVDAYGRVVVDVESRRGIAVADIDIESLGAFRSKFAVWRDADSFVITKS
jgi:predicted amidohydrolase